MPGGTDWDPEIEEKLRACDIFILLVSASDYIVDKEIAIIRERQAKGEDVHLPVAADLDARTRGSIRSRTKTFDRVTPSRFPVFRTTTGSSR